MGFFLDFFFQGGYTLDSAFDLVFDDYPDDFREYYGLDAEYCPEHLDADEWEDYKRLYAVSERLARAAETLVRPRRLPDSQLTEIEQIREAANAENERRRRMLDELKETLTEEQYRYVFSLLWGSGPAKAREDLFRSAMQLHAVERFWTQPGDLATRMTRLLEFLVKTEGPRTQAYLSRLAECYVRGMSTEFAVMSRAVLESALSDTLEEDSVRAHQGIPSNKRVSLDDYISIAVQAGLFDDAHLEAVDQVRDAGNRAVHEFPGIEPDPDEILGHLQLIFQRLEGFRRDGDG